MAKLVERLDKASTAYDMEISAENTKLIKAAATTTTTTTATKKSAVA